MFRVCKQNVKCVPLVVFAMEDLYPMCALLSFLRNGIPYLWLHTGTDVHTPLHIFGLEELIGATMEGMGTQLGTLVLTCLLDVQAVLIAMVQDRVSDN